MEGLVVKVLRVLHIREIGQVGLPQLREESNFFVFWRGQIMQLPH